MKTIKESVEFGGKQAVITVKDSQKKHKYVTATYPCGAQRHYGSMSIYKEYGHDTDHLKHIKSCKACHVVLGLSKAKVMQRQQQVADLFGIGKDGFKANNMKSENGYLYYYVDLKAVRTFKGVITNSQLRGVRSGFSYIHVPEPSTNVIADLPLGAIRALLKRQDFEWMKTIEVLSKGKYWGEYLVKACGELILTTRDTNGRQYAIQLNVDAFGCKTVKDAYKSLKPQIVKRHEKLGKKVLRQGEYYFIPLRNVKDEHVTDIQKVVRKTEVYESWGELKTDTTLEFPKVNDKQDTHHVATRHAKYRGYDVVKGIVRHERGDHRMLKLPKNTWCIAVHNTQARSITVETHDAD